MSTESRLAVLEAENARLAAERDELAAEHERLAARHVAREAELVTAAEDLRELLCTAEEARREVEAERHSLVETNHLLKERLADALRRLYGRRSERLPAIDPAQLELDFGDLAQGVLDAVPPREEEPATTAPDDEADTTPPGRRRRRRPRDPGPGVERVREELDPPPEDLVCPDCGEAKERIGEETSRVLEYVPAKLVLHEIARVKYACRPCEAHVVVAAAPRRPIPRSDVGPGLLAHVLVSKYADHLPLYRQEKMLRRRGADVSRQTLCDWVAGATELLEPLVEALREQVFSTGYVRADETTLRVLRGRPKKPPKKPPKKRRSQPAWMWAYLGEDEEGRRSVLYDFSASRARDGPNHLLADFTGHLQCDGYTGYDEVAARARVVRVGCWAHARRGFYEAWELDPRSGAGEVLGLIAKLYRVEREADHEGLGPEERLAARREHSAPLLEKLQDLLAQLRLVTLPKSRLGRAVAYAQNWWDTLVVFLTDGRLGLDNNPVENQMRAVAVGRKNWLFAGSEAGGRRAATIYSMVESARLAGLDPEAYLTDVITRLPGHPASRVHELLPHAWKAAQAAAAGGDV